MPHFRVDDALHSHPKAQRAGDEALGMWARAGSFCMAYLTDGFVPEWWVRQQPRGMAKAKRLIAAGLWHGGAEKAGEQGFMFHEFVGPGRQDSRAQIESDREKWRKKKQRQRESEQQSLWESPEVSPGDDPGESRVLPNPTQPIENSPTEEHSPNVGGDERGLSQPVHPTASRLVATVIPDRIPATVRTGLRIQASQLINGDGIDPDIVADALRRWLTKPGAGHGLLPSLAADVIRERAAPNGGHPASKLRTIATLAAEERAREQAALQNHHTPPELT